MSSFIKCTVKKKERKGGKNKECITSNVSKMLNVQNVYRFYPTEFFTGKWLVVINESQLLIENMLY